MRYLFYAIALAALAIAGWNTTELLKRQQTSGQSTGITQTSGSTPPELDTRLAEIENSILELAANSGAQSGDNQASSTASSQQLDARLSEIENSILELAANAGGQTSQTLSPSVENRIAKLENEAANTPSGFDASQLFEGMAELAAKIQALENSTSIPSTNSNTSSFDPSDLLTGLAEINERIGKLEQNSPSNSQPVVQSTALEEVNKRLSRLEDREATTPTTFDGDALFEGVAELAARIGNLESQISSREQPSSENQTESEAQASKEITAEIQSITERLVRLENQPDAPVLAENPDKKTEELLAGILEVNQRLDRLENRDAPEVDPNTLIEIAETLKLQADEIAALKTSNNSPGAPTSEILNQAIKPIADRVSALEKNVSAVGNQSETDELLTGMVELSSKVSALETKSDNSELLSKLDTAERRIQELGTALALLQEVEQAGDTNSQSSAMANNIDKLNLRVSKLEDKSAEAPAPSLPPELFSQFQTLSQKLDRIERDADLTVLQSQISAEMSDLTARLKTLESQTNSATGPPEQDTNQLFDTLQTLSTRLASVEDRVASSVQNTGSQTSEALSQLTTRLQKLEQRESGSAITDTAEIESAVSALAERLSEIESAPRFEPASPSNLSEQLTQLVGRIEEFERKPAEDKAARDAIANVTAQIEALTNKIDGFTQAAKSNIEQSPNNEILTGLTELSGRIAVLESKAIKNNAEPIDGDALFEGMATLAHRINELENKLK